MAERSLSFEGNILEIRYPKRPHQHEHLRTELVAPEHGYTLIVDGPSAAREEIPCRFSTGPDHTDNLVTARDASFYHRQFAGLRMDVRKQLIEVGAGMGEFAVQWAEAAAIHADAPKPVVIDPVRYPLLSSMLDCAIALADQERHFRARAGILREMRRRCGVIMNPALVTLVPQALEDAVAEHPELRGTADVVIDFFAAASYPDRARIHAPPGEFYTAGRDAAKQLEYALLKPDGQLFLHTIDYD